MKKIKLGVIGTGLAYQKLHLPALNRLKDKYEIVALSDLDDFKVKKAATEINLEQNTFTDYKELLNLKLDAVMVLVPIELNKKIAQDVIMSGKNLIGEKPIADTVESGEELIKLIEEKNTKVLIGENFRYDEENQIIKKIIDDKKLGDLVYFIDNNITKFKETMHQDDSFSSREWRQYPKFRGGIFLDSAVHHIARIRYLFGDINKLFAVGVKSEESYCPYKSINALLTFNGGVGGHYAYFNSGKETQKPAIGLRIFFTEGEIFLEDRECGFINITYSNGEKELLTYKSSEGYYNQLNNFYDSLIRDEYIVSNAKQELEDVKIIFKILESVEKGIQL